MSAAAAIGVIGAGVGMYGSYMNMRSQINAARLNAQIVQQQATLNAQMAMATGEAQAVAARNRAAFESQMHDMNAKLMMSNSVIAEQDAQSARERMRFEVDQLDRRNRKITGAQAAAYAKAGVTLEGTPADVMFDSALAGEIDELSSLYIGNQEVRKNLIDAYQYRFSAEQQRFNADAVRKFGDDEASFLSWQGNTSAAITLANGRMQSSSLLSTIPAIRNQGYVNMVGSGMQGASMGYSMLRSPTPSTGTSSAGSAWMTK